MSRPNTTILGKTLVFTTFRLHGKYTITECVDHFNDLSITLLVRSGAITMLSDTLTFRKNKLPPSSWCRCMHSVEKWYGYKEREGRDLSKGHHHTLTLFFLTDFISHRFPENHDFSHPLCTWRNVSFPYIVLHTPAASLRAPSRTPQSMELQFFPRMTYSSTKKMETAYSSKTLTTTYQIIRYHIPKTEIFNTCCFYFNPFTDQAKA
jgi:hypothetical protein